MAWYGCRKIPSAGNAGRDRRFALSPGQLLREVLLPDSLMYFMRWY
jgi:hypothetical protein